MSIKDNIKGINKELKVYVKHIGIYAKYQLVTKFMLAVIVYLLFNVVGKMIIKSSGHIVLSSGNFKDILFSFGGIGFVVISLLLFFVAIAIDTNAFIAISASIKRSGKPITIWEAMKFGAKSIKTLVSPAGLFLVIFTLLIVPLASVGLKTSLFKGLKIPNFISSVIEDNPLYLSIYLAVIAIFAIIGFFLLLSFHFMCLTEQNSLEAIKSSIKAVWKNKWDVLKGIVLLNGMLSIVTGIAFFLIYLVIEFLDYKLIGSLVLSRFLMMLSLFIFADIVNLWFFFIGPLQIHMLTGRFYNLQADFVEKRFETESKMAGKKKFRKLSVIVLSLIMLFNMFESGILAVLFDEVFRTRLDVDIVAHRGGGNLGAENTVSGLEAAILSSARWSEIDVMRSKDGVYVINHDKTFERVTGNPKAPSEMTWKEIQKLKVKDHFDSKRPDSKVATLDEFMEAAKDRIGLLIELKGKDADEKMADDVVKAIKTQDTLEQSVIISSDYKLIKYIEDKYPEIQTGYLYFFSLGDTAKIKTDYLIMEESAVSSDMVDKIHREGKAALVWTVNKPENVDKLLDDKVDGLITDYVVEIKAAIERWDNKTDKDIVLGELNRLLTNHWGSLIMIDERK